jgi:HSP20 family molecular chaperone IbpA
MKTESDELQKSLDSIVARAEQLLDRPYASGIDLEDERGDWSERCEVIETMDSVLVILDVSGYALSEVGVSFRSESMCLDVPGARWEQTLPCQVDPASAQRDFRNGILSLRIAKSG